MECSACDPLGSDPYSLEEAEQLAGEHDHDHHQGEPVAEVVDGSLT